MDIAALLALKLRRDPYPSGLVLLPLPGELKRWMS